MKTLPLIRPCTVPVLAVEDSMRAYAIGDEAVVVMCETTNTTDHLLAGSVQAVGYDNRGGIVATAEASALMFWPRQRRALRLALRALSAPIATVRVFTACESEDLVLAPGAESVA